MNEGTPQIVSGHVVGINYLNNFFRLDYRTGLIWAFAAPVCLVIGVNSFMFLKAMLIARKTMRNRKNLSMDETKRTVTLIKGEAGWMTLRISKCCASYLHHLQAVEKRTSLAIFW